MANPIKLSATPVYFRTMRSDEYVLDTQFIPGTTWRVECNVQAEPFAIGIRRDLATVTGEASADKKTWT